MPFRSAADDRGQRDTALARGKFAYSPTSRETASAVTVARRSSECRLRDGGHSSLVAPWYCTERERTPAGVVPCYGVGGRSQPAQHGARARQARVFRHLPRHSQRSGARASVTRKPAVRWRSELAVLHRRREASRRCSALPYRVARPQPARHGARAQQVCMFPTSREKVSAVVLASVPRECRLHVGGHSSHVAPRSCTKR